MTWTAVSPNPAGFIHNANPTTFSITTHAAGNLILLVSTCHNPTSGNEWTSGVSSSRVTWTQITPTHNDVNTQLLVDSSNDVWGGNAWAGTVNTVGSDTVTISWSGPDNPPFFTNAVAMEFHSTVGSWSLDTWTFLQSNAGVSAWPTMTPAKNGELYYGFAWDSSSAASGSTTGYVYNANADSTNNGMAYNLNCAAGVATGPVWGDSNECFGIMLLMQEGTVPGPAYTASMSSM